MKYFLKEQVLHKYPIPAGCSAKYSVGRLLDTKPDGYVECPNCFKKEQPKAL